MQATTFLGEVAVHLFDESALAEDDDAVARLKLRVTINEGSSRFASNIAAKRHA